MKNNNIKKYFTRVNKEKLAEKVSAQIQNLIFSKKIKIGDRLPSERELTKLFGVSRVVVREALQSMEQVGLVETRKGTQNGTYVVFNLYKPFFNSMNILFREGKLSLQDFTDVRIAIECLSVKLAALNANDEDIILLKRINDQLLDDTIDVIKSSEINDNFHVAIADISGNTLIKVIVKSSLELLNSLASANSDAQKVRKNLLQSHNAIIEAISEKDVERCEELMAMDVGFTKYLIPYNRSNM